LWWLLLEIEVDDMSERGEITYLWYQDVAHLSGKRFFAGHHAYRFDVTALYLRKYTGAEIFNGLIGSMSKF